MPVNFENYKTIDSFLKEKNVKLVAVSKTKPIEDILELYDMGQRDFGENYVQELTEKQSKLPADIQWHFIGHLQRNKVKYIAPFVHLIQSVDSEKLLREINKEAKKNDHTIKVLLQVHIADEATKFGFDENELSEILPRIHEYKNVKVEGLMGMATFSDDEKKVAAEFEKLHHLFNQCNQKNSNSWNSLSMGMSADYELAIAHGSTMVRIGSLLFGSRE